MAASMFTCSVQDCGATTLRRKRNLYKARLCQHHMDEMVSKTGYKPGVIAENMAKYREQGKQARNVIAKAEDAAAKDIKHEDIEEQRKKPVPYLDEAGDELGRMIAIIFNKTGMNHEYDVMNLKDGAIRALLYPVMGLTEGDCSMDVFKKELKRRLEQRGIGVLPYEGGCGFCLGTFEERMIKCLQENRTGTSIIAVEPGMVQGGDIKWDPKPPQIVDAGARTGQVDILAEFRERNKLIEDRDKRIEDANKKGRGVPGYY